MHWQYIKKTAKRIKTFIFIASEDRYILSDFKDKFVEKFVDEASRDFNLSYLEEEEAEEFAVLLKSGQQHRPFLPKGDSLLPERLIILPGKRRKKNCLFPYSVIFLKQQ